MRQVNIKTLKAKLSQELLSLPLEITKNGKVIGVISEKGSHIEKEKPQKVVTTSKSGVHRTEAIKEKLVEIIKKKRKVNLPESSISTGGRPLFGYPKSYQARK